ncbi:MAG TPA: hypothetical protein PK986_02300 [Spirochaetota bacterium]|nr:hypothetical protein [Spirochaetota bacterium]HQO39276.1 hypothetical protein [Spirochaetota bacterium]
MKKTGTAAIILLLLLFSPLYSADKTEDIPVGKIEFISAARCEVIVYAATDNGLAAASTGSVLYTLSEKNRIRLTVAQTEGRFIRCTFKCSKNDKSLIREGADVLFAESDNTASGYADVKIFINRLLGIYRDFILDVESSDDPRIIADSVNRLSDSLELLIPEIKRLNAKYPELGNFMDSPPAELKPGVSLLNRTGPLMSDALLKASRLRADKSVAEALKRLEAVMEKMKSSGR